MKKNSYQESSDSSIDDDEQEEYLDEQEDPMTDQQTQNNNNNQTAANAGNTLPIKSTGNAARSVIEKKFFVPFKHTQKNEFYTRF